VKALCNYRPPVWLPDGHSQTIVAALTGRARSNNLPLFHRTRWHTPDSDFVDLDHLGLTPASGERPVLVLFHGLEGSSTSHYALEFARYALGQGLDFVMPHFRGCSGELNMAPRAYHSGDHEEVNWMLCQIKAMANAQPVLAVGVSLGGNALMKWAGEQGAEAKHTVAALASISAPLDLGASGHALAKGLNRQIYTRMFLNSMVPKALAKLKQYPGLFSRERLLRARTLFEFDDVFTAPLHGFKNAEDYWTRASAKPVLNAIRVPTWVLNAKNDPFVPPHSLPTPTDVSPEVLLAQPAQGGHVGFPVSRKKGLLNLSTEWMPRIVGAGLLEMAGLSAGLGTHG
jgi:hypothetical protein